MQQYVYKKKYGHLNYDEEDFIKEYRSFLDNTKTVRLCIDESERLLKKYGFVDINKKTKLICGDKIYLKNKNKSLTAAIIGKNDILMQGANMIFSHVDSPHLDLKPVPYIEKNSFSYFKTHYYGGIKKYQWLTIPLAIKGIIIKDDGKKIYIDEGDDDTVFFISDLLPHLSKDQMQKKAEEIISGEQMNLIIGQTSKENPKSILDLLYRKYGITEENLITAEISVVPAFKSKYVGFDKSMLIGYGQDDKISVFSSLYSLGHVKNVNKTAIITLVDKEEIGSFSNSGVESFFWMQFLLKILKLTNHEYDATALYETLSKSLAISADVNAAYDPNFNEAFELQNSCELGSGVAITKYLGSGGKSSTSECDAETLAMILNVFKKNNIYWNVGELGKIDQSWGGTISRFLANKNMNTIDISIAVLSMHAPLEVISVFDAIQLYKAFKCIYEM